MFEAGARGSITRESLSHGRGSDDGPKQSRDRKGALASAAGHGCVALPPEDRSPFPRPVGEPFPAGPFRALFVATCLLTGFYGPSRLVETLNPVE